MPTVDAGLPTSQILERYGPSLPVRIGYDPVYRLGGPPPNLPGELHLALVDTGASSGGIDSGLAADLSLPVVDVRELSGISGPELFMFYPTQIYIPSLNHVFYSRVAGVHLAQGGILHRAILGRSFLRACSMTYDGYTGSVKINNDGLTGRM